MVLLIGFLIALLLIWYIRGCLKRMNLRTMNELLQEHYIIHLLPAEQQSVLLFAAVSTITFFEGNADESMIRRRLLEILQTNLWLTGRLVTVLHGVEEQRTEIVLAFQKKEIFSTARILQEHFEIITINNDHLHSNTKLHEKQPIHDILATFQNDLVKKGKDCVDRPKEVLFKVLLIKVLEQGQVIRTALIVSMSHVLGDGHSFYLIHNMFDYQAKIVSYLPQRVMSFPENIEKTIGNAFPTYLKSIPFILSVIFRSLFGTRKHMLVFTIDLEKIKQLKEEYQRNGNLDSSPSNNRSTGDNNFISTNDILTSWFFSTLQVTHGMMPVNYRNKFPEISNHHIGNYLASMLFHPQLYHKAERIRRALQHYEKSFVRTPTLLETLQFHMATVTNWSSFFREIKLTPSQRSLFHSPLVSGKVPISAAMIIFRPSPEALAMYIVCDTQYSEKYWLQRGEFLRPSY